MKRLFSTLAAIALLIIGIIGVGIIWLGSSQLQEAQRQTTEATAEGLAVSLSAQMQLLQKLVEALAQSPVVASALTSQEPGQLQQAATQVAQFIPGVLKVRLLLPETHVVDTVSTPAMGYADLDMVRESLTATQFPAIHDQGINQHLAIAARCIKNNSTIGVILASINPDVIYNKFHNINLTNAQVALVQGDVVLQQHGAGEIDEQQASALPVANTGWQIRFTNTDTLDWAQFSIGLGLLALMASLTGLLFYFGFKQLRGMLANDQAAIAKAIKELSSAQGKTQYLTQLEGMETVITDLFEYAHNLNQPHHGTDAPTANEGRLKMFIDDDDEDSRFAEVMSNPRVAAQAFESQGVAPSPLENKLPKSAKPSVKVSASKAGAEIFRAYDIRGVVDKNITEAKVFEIGRAFGTEVRAQGVSQLAMGYDGRISSPNFAIAMAKGIATAGVNVIDVGLVPSPVLYYAAYQFEGKTGVMITGSHNPPNYNGIKMMLNGKPLSEIEIQALKQRIDNGDYVAGTGSIQRNTHVSNDYIGGMAEDIHLVRPMKVVIDCGNGAASPIAPGLFKTLGCEVIELFCTVDGTFPNHHPDPSKPENMHDLMAAVQHYAADIGIAFDGDGDRLGVVDGKGKIIWPDRQMMLFARQILKVQAGAQIVYDVKCSKHLGEQIVAFGGRPVMWKSGHSRIKAKLQETGAKLGGEMSGHLVFNDQRWYPFDDALYAAARLLEILSTDPRPSAQIFAAFPDSYNTPEINVPLPEGEKFRFIEVLKNSATFPQAEIIDIDGLRVEFADGWGLVRASNTTPSLVLRFEADSPAAMQRIQTEFKAVLLKTNPHLLLPF